jgi:ubiquinone biosynthesis protein UbiJ
MLPPLPYPLLIQLLNALLARESWARERLRPHAGKVVRLVLGSVEISLEIASGGGIQAARQAEPNVVLTMAAQDLPRMLRADTHERMQAVRIEGEAALAHVVADLARDLRWDVEDDLAGLVGDLPARMLVRGARGLFGGMRETAVRLNQNAVEYATHEAALLPARAAISAWSAEVTSIDQATRSLEQRIAWLERRRRGNS